MAAGLPSLIPGADPSTWVGFLPWEVALRGALDGRPLLHENEEKKKRKEKARGRPPRGLSCKYLLKFHDQAFRRVAFTSVDHNDARWMHRWNEISAGFVVCCPTMRETAFAPCSCLHPMSTCVVHSPANVALMCSGPPERLSRLLSAILQGAQLTSRQPAQATLKAETPPPVPEKQAESAMGRTLGDKDLRAGEGGEHLPQTQADASKRQSGHFSAW